MALELDPPFDAAEYLTDTTSQADLINDALASGHAGYIANALGVVARARGMTDLSRETGIKRQTLYKALSPDGNPTLGTMAKVFGALGLRLAVSPLPVAHDNAFHEGAFDVTATGEEAVVGKTAHVVEEIIVSKTASEHVETIADSVRRTNVEAKRGTKASRQRA